MLQLRGIKRQLKFLLTITACSSAALWLWYWIVPIKVDHYIVKQSISADGQLDNTSISDSKANWLSVSSHHPFIFIGGMPRSGTTLMRAMLDSHTDISCGAETRVLPRLLQLYTMVTSQASEAKRLKAAGVLGKPLDSAVAAFVMQLLLHHSGGVRRMCAKDPFVLVHMRLLSKLFPNAKFIMMLRDGRAFVDSIVNRKVSISGYDLTRPKLCLQRWNYQIKHMYSVCEQLGDQLCLPVKYEELLLDPPAVLADITKFLGLQLQAPMLRPWQQVGNQVQLSSAEPSTGQVREPLYLRSLTAWSRRLSPELIANAHRWAPMLRRLGYDQVAMPPSYGRPNPNVWRNGTYHCC